ncbi:hypothetical protein DFQ28_001049 [Apophysomyces sp. BC1034]|nr:hypothetical protein DFQ30_008887 [Apophysomyces sp. BC1015]KAG0181392.1 hypothetical protein DFQ29_008449 [Apophysomyces sp. BC1021]KAG0191054.1 hypothetical protein DFQ28_001049 [Apophysomyces sp. BC1034]
MEGLKLVGEASSTRGQIMSCALVDVGNQEDDDEYDNTEIVDGFSSQHSTPNRRKRTLVLIDDDAN